MARELGDKVGMHVWDVVRRSLTEDLKNKNMSFTDHFLGLGNWSGWSAYMEFMHYSGLVKQPQHIMDFIKNMKSARIWTASFFKGIVFTSPTPTNVELNDKGNLHSSNEWGHAIRWPNGHFMHFEDGKFTFLGAL